MAKKDDDREITRETFVKLNDMVKKIIQEREDIDVLPISYNDTISNPRDNLRKIANFLGMSDDILDQMINAVDNKLYRQRRT